MLDRSGRYPFLVVELTIDLATLRFDLYGAYVAEERFFEGVWAVRAAAFFVVTVTPFPEEEGCTPMAFLKQCQWEILGMALYRG